MKPVNQTIIDRDRGDCVRAAIASLLELEIEQVPHFILFEDNWFDIFYWFLWSLGYEYVAYKYNICDIKDENLINGCLYASVNSKTFVDRSHAVLINRDGLVIHDPNPNKLWEGINVAESIELKYYYVINKRKTEEKD